MANVLTETTVTHVPLTRRSEIVIVLNGGDIAEREATARAILVQLAEYIPPTPVPPAPALSPLFTLLSEGSAALPTDTVLSLTAAAPHAAAPTYDEPFILAPLDDDRLGTEAELLRQV